MREKIILADNLALDKIEAATEKVAFIGRSGSGKTYAAMKYAEELYRAGMQIVVIDQVGVWWGLRLSSDGKGPGLDIPIIGGQRGDIPLEPSAGSLIAELASQGYSLVLDVSEMTLGEMYQFTEHFGTDLLRLKKHRRSALTLIWEEAQDFMPENVDRRTARMFHALSRLTKIGRNFGIGTMLITQRPQAISKDVLNQTELLVVFQTNGYHERKALREWIAGKGDGSAKDLVEKLPLLKCGDGYIWSPSWLRKYEPVRFRPKSTYDASATPGRGASESIRPRPLDLADLRRRMSETIERAKRDDPDEMRRKIAELERRLAKVSPHNSESAIKNAVEKALASERGRISSGVARTQRSLNQILQKINDTYPSLCAALTAAVDGIAEISASPSAPETRGGLPVLAPPPFEGRQFAPASYARSQASSEPELPRGEIAVLTACAQHSDGCDRDQLSILTGYKRSTRDAY